MAGGVDPAEAAAKYHDPGFRRRGSCLAQWRAPIVEVILTGAAVELLYDVGLGVSEEGNRRANEVGNVVPIGSGGRMRSPEATFALLFQPGRGVRGNCQRTARWAKSSLSGERTVIDVVADLPTGGNCYQRGPGQRSAVWR